MTRTSVSGEISRAIRASRRLMVIVAIFSVFTNLLMLTGPLFMLQVYDRVLASRSEETLIALFALVAALYFFYWVIEYARGRVMSRSGAALQSALGKPVLAVALDRAATGQSGRDASVQDLDHVRAFYNAPVVLALFDLPWTPLFAAAIFVFHPWLGWLAVAGGGLLILSALANQMLTASRLRASAETSAMATDVARQAELGARFLRAQGMSEALISRWFRLQEAATDQAVRGADWTGSFTAFSKAFRLFLQSAMLAAGAWLVLRGELTPGAMIAASILLGRALAPIEVCVSQWPLAQRGLSSWRAIRRTLAQGTDTADRTTLPRPIPDLACRDLTLVLPGMEHPVLANVTFRIAPGEALGVIGRSGSGKTTLAQVIVGLAPPTSGKVTLDGAQLNQYGPEDLGRHVGYLPQEVQLFNGTIAENIARMTDAPEPDLVIDAARKAHVHDIILRLPQGYDTVIGSAGTPLSGGQKQRLALARAIYTDPVLLVLDEPNSALDADGTAALNDVIRAMKDAGKSVIIMTHRPTAISVCDTLLVLDQGRVAAQGPRDDIIRSMMKNSEAVQQVVTRDARG